MNNNTGETFACYQAAGFFNTQVRIYNSGLLCDENSLLGVGTHVPLAAVDFSKAGSGPGPGLSSARAMRTPHSTTAQRVGVITQTGSIIYNTDAGEHQAYCDDEWVGFANQTGIVTAKWIHKWNWNSCSNKCSWIYFNIYSSRNWKHKFDFILI